MTCHYDSPHRKCLCLSLEGRHFTENHTLVTCPLITSCLHSLMNTCSLVHCSSLQEATGYWWFNDITSDDGGWPDRRSRDPLLPCFVSRLEGAAGPAQLLLHHQDRSSSKHWLFGPVMVMVKSHYLPSLPGHNITMIILAKWGSCGFCIFLNDLELET